MAAALSGGFDLRCVGRGAAAETVFDETALLNRLMGDRDIARTVVGSFLEDIPRQLAALGARLAARDAAGAMLHAHRIKGAAANLTTGALVKAAQDIEQAGKAGD